MNLIKKSLYGLMIYNNSDIWVGRSIEKYGEYSESEVQVFRDFIKPGFAILDVGANTGSHTIAFSRLTGPSGTVFAYEPERTNFTTLCGNIAINNIQNVYCFQKAVGSTSGFIDVPELDHGRMTNYGSVSLNVDYSQASTYPVPLIALDDSNFIRCNFIKIDIEGMEKFALMGAEKTIKTHKPILYVENDRDDNGQPSMTGSNNLIEYIKSLDYVVYKHFAPLFNPNNYFENKENVFLNEQGVQFLSVNVFCHHKDAPCPIDPQKFAMEKVN